MQKFKTTHGNKAEVSKFRYNDRDKNFRTNLPIENFVLLN
jgi:hypothetical protein